MVRTILDVTQAHLAGKYTVHELLLPNDPVLPCSPEDLNDNENPGRDIRCDNDHRWKSLENAEGVQVHAALITHRGTTPPSIRISARF